MEITLEYKLLFIEFIGNHYIKLQSSNIEKEYQTLDCFGIKIAHAETIIIQTSHLF